MHRATAVLVLLLLAVAAPLGAQAPVFSVAVAQGTAAGRPVARVQGLLADGALRDALAAGLPLRLHARVELWRKAFFDRLDGEGGVSLVLTRDALDGAYVIEDGRASRSYATAARAEAAINAALGFDVAPRRGGRYYYLAALEVRTLSASDLEELRRWLRGEAQPAVQGRVPVERAVGRGVQRALERAIGLPTRRYEARTATFALP